MHDQDSIQYQASCPDEIPCWGHMLTIHQSILPVDPQDLWISYATLASCVLYAEWIGNRIDNINYFTKRNSANNSFLVMQYLCSNFVKLLLANAKGCFMPSWSCCSTALTEKFLASVFKMKLLFRFEFDRTA